VAVVSGVDLDRLETWMDTVGLGGGPLTQVEPLAGGTQNIMLRFRRQERRFVLRHPPHHKRANSDQTMRREASVLAALAGSDVPHPALVAACPDIDVLGSAFYIMESIDGFNPGLGLPEPHRSDAALQRTMGLSMADAIAALGRVDHVAVGLANLGKPDGWLERQVQRWQSHLASYDGIEGYPGSDLPGITEIGAWLEARRPATWTAGLIHGDFHLANVLVHPIEGRLVAVVDWELATIGDPLLDLGHLLCTWPGPEGRPNLTVGSPAGGLPTREHLIARYAEGSSRDTGYVDWYEVLACYRLGIILEGTNARAAAGLAPSEVGDRLHATAVSLLERAQELTE
jgi:aminoglycoside phosphotransferase (APT) family kinase protein